MFDFGSMIYTVPALLIAITIHTGTFNCHYHT